MRHCPKNLPIANFKHCQLCTKPVRRIAQKQDRLFREVVGEAEGYVGLQGDADYTLDWLGEGGVGGEGEDLRGLAGVAVSDEEFGGENDAAVVERAQ